MIAAIAGVITAVIRVFSPIYPEGVCFAILAVNVLLYAIEQLKKPHIYGVSSKKAE